MDKYLSKAEFNGIKYKAITQVGVAIILTQGNINKPNSSRRGRPAFDRTGEGISRGALKLARTLLTDVKPKEQKKQTKLPFV